MKNKGWQSLFLPRPRPNPHKHPTFYTLLCLERSPWAISQHLTLQTPQRKQTLCFPSQRKGSINPLSLMRVAERSHWISPSAKTCGLRSEKQSSCEAIGYVPKSAASLLPGRGWALRNAYREQKGTGVGVIWAIRPRSRIWWAGGLGVGDTELFLLAALVGLSQDER